MRLQALLCKSCLMLPRHQAMSQKSMGCGELNATREDAPCAACTTSAKAPIGAAAGTLEIASFQQFAMLLCSMPSGETPSARCLTGTSLWTTSPPVFCQPGCKAWTFRWAAAALEHSFCCQTSHGSGVHASADLGCKRRYNQARTSVHRYPCWRGRGADVSCHGLHVSQGAVGALIF